jgi:probable phosphoglycerate mutase
VSRPAILAIRHGATELSASGAFVGRGDPSLSADGAVQAAAWQPFAASGLVDRALASPLARAVETAQIAGFAPLELDPALTEWDLGELEGQHAEDWRTAHPGWSLFTDGAPGGEGVAEVAARVRSVAASAANGGFVVLVAHGQLLKLLATEILGLPAEAAATLALGPARAGLYLRRAAGWRLAGWNLPAPLDPAAFLADLT